MSSLDSWDADRAEVDRRDGREGAGDFSRQGSDSIDWVRIPLVLEFVSICDWDMRLVIPLVLELLSTSLTTLRLITVLVFFVALATTLVSSSVFSCVCWVSLTSYRLATSWHRLAYCWDKSDRLARNITQLSTMISSSRLASLSACSQLEGRICLLATTQLHTKHTSK